jgi:DNA topoisomerase-1
MEEDLDQISRGERDWLEFIGQFYRGDRHHRGLEDAARQAEQNADYPLIDVGSHPESDERIAVRIGRFGPFLQQGEGGPGKTSSLPPALAPADLTVDKAIDLLRAKAEGPRLLGVDPSTGQSVYAIHGRFGAYVQLGETPEKGSKEKPKRSSLTGGMNESTVTLEEALRLLQLPRELGRHPESGEPVVAGLGRFGPYVKHGDDFRSLESDEELFTVGLDRALQLFSEPKRSRRRQAAVKVIATISKPDGTPLQVLEGRYGPYVTDGEINASIPKGVDPSTLTFGMANDLLEARRSAAPRPKRRRPAGGSRKKAAAAERVDATAQEPEKASKTVSKKAPKKAASRRPRKVAVPS